LQHFKRNALELETYGRALLFSHASSDGRIIPPALSAAYHAALDCAVGLVAVPVLLPQR
jgi:hypothetical protein